MWVRWGEGINASTDGGDATIDGVNLTMVLPGGAALISQLRDLLREPEPLEALERQLLRANPAAGVAEVLRELINAQVLTPWEIGPELARLHQETVRSVEGPLVPAMSEIGRMFRETTGSGVLLPYAEEIRISFAEVLNARRSCRAFRPQSLALEQIGAVLSLAASAGGDEPPAPKADGGPPAARSYPSGGGLYPAEILVYPTDVDGIDEAFYYYQPLAHRLVPSSPKAPGGLAPLMADQPVAGAAFFVLLFLDFTRLSLSRYGKKSYRLALLEVGHLAQNVLLAATAVGLATLPICGFDDEGVSRAAGLRYPEQPVVYALAVGSGG
jgi:SagB-type dehydrogenase family enzyme